MTAKNIATYVLVFTVSVFVPILGWAIAGWFLGRAIKAARAERSA